MPSSVRCDGYLEIICILKGRYLSNVSSSVSKSQAMQSERRVEGVQSCLRLSRSMSPRANRKMASVFKQWPLSTLATPVSTVDQCASATTATNINDKIWKQHRKQLNSVYAEILNKQLSWQRSYFPRQLTDTRTPIPGCSASAIGSFSIAREQKFGLNGNIMNKVNCIHSVQYSCFIYFRSFFSVISVPLYSSNNC